MGRVKIKVVKRTALELFKRYPDIWTKDFEKNKKLVQALLKKVSKKFRNQIAGYLVRLVKFKEQNKLPIQYLR
ncbi:NEQ320 [Nanoarchaeum equitans Kin4-M]|uniref:Small ribosomal subunit protein eS17 n=1 Tax=Nanoarchaeum equitans (strain Kin4-M) TaxID=228908 RepID=RS17E_NANEQ|nr:RecName: Full=Small ribosomal subunit protein eS17; AltName: Full=30S ribosomal protein S17e [Nanoarchaeum equitans Kin4-M]AAR39169.1 NEQ320 [Nanoarchaeum equitans Kin4-M]